MRNTAEQNQEPGVVERSSNPNFVDIPTSELFAELNRQVTEAPAGSEFPDAVLLDLVDPPPLVALLRKLLVHDEWTTLRMCDPAPPCVLGTLTVVRSAADGSAACHATARCLQVCHPEPNVPYIDAHDVRARHAWLHWVAPRL